MISQTKFPYWQMAIICIMRFSEPLAFTSLFPYIYFMIRDFGIAANEKDISRYSGYLASSFALTQFMCSVRVGRMSDKYGRKPVILMGLLGSATSMVIFGFATNFYMALGARAFMGCVNGNIAVIRTQIGELVTEKNHQAVAYTSMPFIWNLGSVIGPLIGGSSLLTRPERHSYPGETSYDKFLNKHPYAMPNVLVASFLVMSCICGILFLEETNEKCKYRRDYGLDLGDFILRRFGFNPPIRPWNGFGRISSHDSLESIGLMDYPRSLLNDDLELTEGSVLGLNDSVEGSVVEGSLNNDSVLTENSSKNSNRDSTVNSIQNTENSSQEESEEPEDIIMTGPVIKNIIAYFLLTCHVPTFGEFLPVFMASPISAKNLKFPFHISGGFGMLSDSIGSFMATTGIIGMASIFVFPLLDRKFNGVWVYRGSVFIYPLLYCALPFVIFTIPQYNPEMGPNTFKVLLFILAVTLQASSSVSSSSLNLLINRVAPINHKGAVNAIALSFSSLARFIGPMLGGVIMSYFNKINFGGGTWFTLAFISFGAFLQSFSLSTGDYE